MSVEDVAGTKIVKGIRVDVDKCTGCKTCELGCSAVHAVPMYGTVNPARSRIRVVMDELRDVYLPIRGREPAAAECNGRNRYVIDGKEHSDCSFCRASCPSRDAFQEPDSGLPLICDMCEGLSLSEPMCVQVCRQGALTYVERREAPSGADEPKRDDVSAALEALVRRFGFRRVRDTVVRKARKSR